MCFTRSCLCVFLNKPVYVGSDLLDRILSTGKCLTEPHMCPHRSSNHHGMCMGFLRDRIAIEYAHCTARGRAAERTAPDLSGPMIMKWRRERIFSRDTPMSNSSCACRDRYIYILRLCWRTSSTYTKSFSFYMF